MLKRLSLALLLLASTSAAVVGVAPGAPQTFAATVIGNTVTFTWGAPSTGAVSSGYLVEAALSPLGLTIASLPTPASPLAVPNVPNGVYYVRVRSVNPDGVSEASNEVIVVVPGGGGGPPSASCTLPPNPPQNLTSSAAGNFVTLNWSPSAGGCAATGYAVHAGSAPGLSNITVANVGAATSLTSGAPGGQYYIRVIALNAFGGSVASNETAVTVGATCLAPSAPPLMLTPTINGANVSLTWVSPGGNVTGYVVEAGSSSGAANLLNTMTGATSYTWSNATTGTHFIRVRAINTCGTGPVSNQVTASVTAASTPPPTTSRFRTGAICRDGWRSTATGSGACSSHGGVSCWLYNDNSCTNP